MNVTFGAGVTFGELVNELNKSKFALPDLPEDPDENIVESIITGGHGRSIHNKSFVNYVTSVKYVDP